MRSASAKPARARRKAVARGLPGEDDPGQIEGQVRAQRWLAGIGFPTPELLCIVWRCPELGGRQLSVQRYVDAVDETGDVLEATPVHERAAYFEGFCRAVGMLHSFDLPEFGGWHDDSGVRHDTWAEAIHPASALLVREWDFPYDFSCRLDGVFAFFEGSREPFMAGYREVAGELPDSYALRNWLYTGIYASSATAEFIDGNDGYAGAPRELRTWLEGTAPG